MVAKRRGRHEHRSALDGTLNVEAEEAVGCQFCEQALNRLIPVPCGALERLERLGQATASGLGLSPRLLPRRNVFDLTHNSEDGALPLSHAAQREPRCLILWFTKLGTAPTANAPGGGRSLPAPGISAAARSRAEPR